MDVCPDTGVGMTELMSIWMCGGSGNYSSSKIWKMEVVAASKKYLAFTQDDLSNIYESFIPSVLKVMTFT